MPANYCRFSSLFFITYFYLQVLGYLPLDWLSDDNHSRCLIGLFTCDMLFNSALLKVTTSLIVATVVDKSVGTYSNFCSPFPYLPHSQC